VGVSQTITFVVPGGAPPTTVAVAAATTAPAGTTMGTLPRTGSPSLALLVWLAVVLIVAGRLLLAGSHRLRAQHGRQVSGS
jgi:hypothetical protein